MKIMEIGLPKVIAFTQIIFQKCIFEAKLLNQSN